MKTTQMTHELLDTDTGRLSNNQLMVLKMELLQKVNQISNELTLRAMAESVS